MCAIGIVLIGNGVVLARHQPAPSLESPQPLAAAVEPVRQRVLIEPPAGPAPAVRGRAGGKKTSAVVDAEAAPPRRVLIPSIGVDSSLIGLRQERDGALEVPQDFAQAGWYRQGTKPGDTGPAVLVGHVDSHEGPAVFFRLRELRRDDRITVVRTDGSKVVFAVYASERVAKNDFPTDRVYGDTRGPELRVLTCGGRFDPVSKSYEDNVVVYARQVRR